jgi:hypothetical protein
MVIIICSLKRPLKCLKGNHNPSPCFYVVHPKQQMNARSVK